jgi:DNA invertase Pin-like site-specific DNA recombinase
VFREVASGAKTDRAQLCRLLGVLDAGDVLLVTRLDRLGPYPNRGRMRDAWSRDAGMRLDHLLLSETIAKRFDLHQRGSRSATEPQARARCHAGVGQGKRS